MSMHKPIRDMNKRFQIVFYHLEKIIEDWGECRGISSNDTNKIGSLLGQLNQLYSRRTFEAFEGSPFIPEEEFDNEPQANTELQLENKRLQKAFQSAKDMIAKIKRNLGIE